MSRKNSTVNKDGVSASCFSCSSTRNTQMLASLCLIFLTFFLNLSLGNSESDEEDVSVPSLSSQNSAFGKSIIFLTYYQLYYQFPRSVMDKLKKILAVN